MASNWIGKWVGGWLGKWLGGLGPSATPTREVLTFTVWLTRTTNESAALAMRVFGSIIRLPSGEEGCGFYRNAFASVTFDAIDGGSVGLF